MSEPHRYERLPLEVTAIELTQYGDFVRTQVWITDNGGNASFAPATSWNGGEDYLLLATADGTVEARVGDFVVFWPLYGNFTVWGAERFHEGHRPIPEPLYDEGLTGTGTYVVGRPDGRTSLVGGAALPLPT